MTLGELWPALTSSPARMRPPGVNNNACWRTWKRQGRPRDCAAIKTVRHSMWKVSRICETGEAFAWPRSRPEVCRRRVGSAASPPVKLETTSSGTSSSGIRCFVVHEAGTGRRRCLTLDVSRNADGSESRFLCAVRRVVARCLFCVLYVFCLLSVL